MARHGLISFNSVKVQLKVDTLPPEDEDHLMFQFRKGAIKGFLQSVNMQAEDMFQFRKGAIKGRGLK